MPRALTEQEKCKQCQTLLEKGKAVVFSHGIKKVSVDDIVKAAGMAKGTFYQHFETKEQYLSALIDNLHKQIFIKAEQLLNSFEDIKSNANAFFTGLFNMPEMLFFIQNESDITTLLELMPNQERISFKQMELVLFEKMLRLAGADTEKVKAGIVHNYVHTLFLISGSDLMIEENRKETVDMITANLITYIFGGGAAV
jgi:AcrR family transcriptional regulator